MLSFGSRAAKTPKAGEHGLVSKVSSPPAIFSALSGAGYGLVRE